MTRTFFREIAKLGVRDVIPRPRVPGFETIPMPYSETRLGYPQKAQSLAAFTLPCWLSLLKVRVYSTLLLT